MRTAVQLALAVGGGLGAALMWALRGVGSAHPQIEIAVVAGFGLIALVLAVVMANAGRGAQPYPNPQPQPQPHQNQHQHPDPQPVQRAREREMVVGREMPPAAPPAAPAAARIQAEASMTIARRVLALIVRVLRELDALERETEDPQALKSLFVIDEQVTRIRRSIETLAVFGGVAPRTAPRPVAVHTLVRQAVAEIEDYRRVRILPPVLGRVHGVAATDIIHLIAELVENAAKFSRPETEVAVRVQEVTAGVAIDIDDRGLGMERQECERACALLAGLDPQQVAQRLGDGQLGYLASAHFAARHGIAVRVESNVVGGIHALILLPHAVLEAGPVTAEPLITAGPVAVGHHTAGPVAAGHLPAGGHAAASRVAEVPRQTAVSAGRPPLPRREGSYLPQPTAFEPAAPETTSPEPARGDSGEAVFTPGLLAGYRSGFQSGADTWAGEDGANEYEPPRWEA